MALKHVKPIQHVLERYSDIRSQYKARAEGGANPAPPVLTDSHGFFLSQSGNFLTERFAGMDKLFYTLIHGIVEDPDFAVRKDSKIYDKMMRDPQIYYCLSVRKTAVSSLPWILKPPMGFERDKAAGNFAAATERRLRRIPRFSELLDNIMDALLPGLSVNELVWQVGDDGSYTVKDHHPVNKDRVKFDKDGKLYLLSPRQPTTGLLCPPYKFIVHRFNVTDGSWKEPSTGGYSYYGRGLADTPLYHYFYFKMMALKFLMKELERYGMPFKLLYTGAQNEAMATKLSEIMTALKNDAVVNIPGRKGDVNVEVVKAARSGNMFMLFINYVDSLITKVVLGQELMTEMPGVGSYAAAAVHRSVFAMINERDRTLVRDTINKTIIRYDVQLNTPNLKEELYPVFDFKKSPVEELDPFLATVDEAVKLGVPVSVAQFREYTGLREPYEGEETLQPPVPEPMPGQINSNVNANANANVNTKPNVNAKPDARSRLKAKASDTRSKSRKNVGARGKASSSKVS